VQDVLSDYHGSLQAIIDGTAEDAVRTLAGEGASLKAARDRAQEIRGAVTAAGLETIRLARTAAGGMSAALAERGENGALAAKTQALRERLTSATFYQVLPQIKQEAGDISAAYDAAYTALHNKRHAAFAAAMEDVKGNADWPALAGDVQNSVLSPLSLRACASPDLPAGATACRTCSATLAQMESDLAALPGLKSQVLARIHELTAPQEKIERVQVAEFFGGSLDTEAAVEEAVERLREHLLKLVAEKVKIILE
jgi:hypothetical protein